MKKFIAILLAAMMLMGTLCSASAATFLTIATGGTTGTYYPLGGDIANLFNQMIPDVRANAEATGGSAANLRKINAGEADLGTVQNDVSWFAYTGTDSFEGEQIQSFSVVSSLYAEYVQIVTRKDSGINSIADFAGKRISIGAAGSGVYTNALHVLESAGLTLDDIDAQYLSFSESADGLKNKQIDAAFITAGIPNAAITELGSTVEVKLISLTDEEVANLIAAHPTYANLKLAKETYALEEDVNCVAITALLVCANSLDEELVYNMTKALYEQEGILTHAKAAEITLDSFDVGVGELPWHPGAQRYYQEVGALAAE